MRKVVFGIGVQAVAIAAVLLAACSSKSVLNDHQLHTLLQCPCPTIAPLAEFPLPSELPFGANAYFGGLATGSDGNAWVPEFDANKIARVSVSGVVTEFAIPTLNAGPNWIAQGPDNNLWFSEDNAPVNTIARITTAGVVTEFPLPPPLDTRTPQGYGLSTFATGPDGNIWFAHAAANVIGVIRFPVVGSALDITTYPIPTGNSVVGWISAGPGGTMWFSEEAANKIGRLTISTGHIDEFPIPTPNSHPNDLVVGPDGNMWFPEAAVGNVARVTPSGIITEFPMVADPTRHWLARLVVTADGSLWFNSAAKAAPWDAEIGRFDITGTELDLWSFTLGSPRAMGIGPDGSPWFCDEANDVVVRL